MTVECFAGNSMPEVMADVHAKWGDEAVILHTDQRRRRLPWFGRKPRVRVWATLTPDEPLEKAQPLLAQALDPTPELGDSDRLLTFRSPVAGDPASEAAARMEQQMRLLTSMVMGVGHDADTTNVMSALWGCGADWDTVQALCRRGASSCEGEADPLRALLRDHLPVTGGIKPSTRVAALVGSTGVGKTTSVAKIAATEMVQRRRRVALVTVDVYRVGAVQQLETYARLMGLPFFVVTVPEEARQAIEQAKQIADLVLVDTIGRSPRHVEQLGELHELVSAMAPEEVLLTLPANGNSADLLLTAEQFGCFQPTSLIFTKLDEALQPGVLVNVVHKSGLPVSYVALGQNVPEDIEAPDTDRLVELALLPNEDAPEEVCEVA